jgi:hypothetical protein
MLCKELERLQSQLICTRTEQRRPGLTGKQKMALVAAEKELVMDIKEHQSAGHDGQQCFGE